MKRSKLKTTDTTTITTAFVTGLRTKAHKNKTTTNQRRNTTRWLETYLPRMTSDKGNGYIPLNWGMNK
jgi:hypothetical protein